MDMSSHDQQNDDSSMSMGVNIVSIIAVIPLVRTDLQLAHIFDNSTPFRYSCRYSRRKYNYDTCTYT